MYFAKDEIIELNNHKKYLIVDTAILDDEVYYKIREYNSTLKAEDFLYITTINKEGKIYINSKINGEELKRVKQVFES